MAKLQSMEDFINRKSLYVRDIDPRTAKFEVKSDLQPVCPKDLGQICVPVDEITQNGLGYAYCNFNSSTDAREALKAYRFKLKVGGKPVNIAYSVSSKDRPKILGAWGYRLSIIVKNLSPDVTDKMLCDKFETFGEIFRCKVGMADYGATYGLVQYVEERSVIKAVHQANQATWLSSVLVVERHEKVVEASRPAAPVRDPSLMDQSRSAAAGPSSSFSSETNGRPAVVDLIIPSNPEQGFAPYFEMNDLGGSDPRASLAFDNIEQQCGVSSHRAAPQLETQPRLPLMLPKAIEKRRMTPSPSNSSSNGGSTFVYDKERAEETVPIFGLMDRKKKMYEKISKLSYGKTQSANRTWNGLAQPSKEKTVGDSKMKLKDALDYLANGSKAVAKVMTEFEKLTGGQVGEGLLCCPITQEMFRDPVLASDGHTYERSAIHEWLFTKCHNTSPLTNEELPNRELIPNKLITKIVEALT